MSFNAAIPIGTDPMIKSQIQTRANFQAMNAVFGQNHVPFNQDNSISGMHSVINFREQTVDPTTSAAQIGLYTKNVSGSPALFFAPSSSQTPIQMTYPSINTSPTLAQQQTFVAGPFVVYCGYLTGVNNGAAITPTPTSNLIYVGLMVAQGNPRLGINAIGVISGSSFTIQFPGPGGQTIWYLAIGKP